MESSPSEGGGATERRPRGLGWGGGGWGEGGWRGGVYDPGALDAPMPLPAVLPTSAVLVSLSAGRLGSNSGLVKKPSRLPDSLIAFLIFPIIQPADLLLVNGPEINGPRPRPGLVPAHGKRPVG